MVPLIRTYKYRLARIAEFIQTKIPKVGITREQLFHTWRSLNFVENTETIDAYVT